MSLELILQAKIACLESAKEVSTTIEDLMENTKKLMDLIGVSNL